MLVSTCSPPASATPTYLRLFTGHGDPGSGGTPAAASITRRTSALPGFYRYAARHGAAPGFLFTGIERPAVDDER